MPRYFFHVGDGRDIRDAEGTVLADVATARREAVRLAGTLLSEEERAEWPEGRWDLQVTDAHDRVLFVLTVRMETSESP